MSVAVIIPTYNAHKTLPELLEALKGQTVRFDLVVIDSDSTDGTPELAGSFGAKMISIKKSEFNHSQTRNFAAKCISDAAEYLVFMTQDCTPVDKYTLEQLIKPLKDDTSIALSYARQLPFKNAGTLESLARELNYPPAPLLKNSKSIPSMGLKTFFCSNSCSAIRRSTFYELGAFTEGLPVNEDMDFAYRAIEKGYSIYYAAQAQVYHSHKLNLKQLWLRYYQTGRFFAIVNFPRSVKKSKHLAICFFTNGIMPLVKCGKPHLVPVYFLESLIKALALKSGMIVEKFHKTKKTS